MLLILVQPQAGALCLRRPCVLYLFHVEKYDWKYQRSVQGATSSKSWI